MKRFTRFLALTWGLILLWTLLPLQAAAAEEAPCLTVESVGGQRGGSVVVTVSLDRVGGIAGGGFQVQYDPGQLTLMDASAGAALPSATINKHFADNAVKVSFASMTALAQPGALCVLTFRVNEDAALGDSAVTVVGERFYDETGDLVPVTKASGTVTAQSVLLSLDEAQCLPGQAAVLTVELGGGLLPTGGEFEIHYNDRMMTAGSVKAVEKLGQVGVNVSANVQYAPGVVKVSWAASEPVTALGQLCTVIFAVDSSASGETAVTLENVKFFDETGAPLDAQTVDGSVTAVTTYQKTPTLYVVGGALREDGTATVRVALDGAGTICGGSFTVGYDQEKCTLTETTAVQQAAAVNPEDDGALKVSWAEHSPALDNETILELTFQVQEGEAAELTLSDVQLRDKDGKLVAAAVHSGRIGVLGSVQQPVTSVVNTENTVAVTATLYDAEFCDQGRQTESAWVICAGYVNGKMKLASLPSSSVAFDQNGIATVTLELNDELTSMTQIQLFTLSGQDTMIPLCEKVQISTSADQ